MFCKQSPTEFGYFHVSTHEANVFYMLKIKTRKNIIREGANGLKQWIFIHDIIWILKVANKSRRRALKTGTPGGGRALKKGSL